MEIVRDRAAARTVVNVASAVFAEPTELTEVISKWNVVLHVSELSISEWLVTEVESLTFAPYMESSRSPRGCSQLRWSSNYRGGGRCGRDRNSTDDNRASASGKCGVRRACGAPRTDGSYLVVIRGITRERGERQGMTGQQSGVANVRSIRGGQTVVHAAAGTHVGGPTHRGGGRCW